MIRSTDSWPDITITTSANTDDEGRALLGALNFPFKK